MIAEKNFGAHSARVEMWLVVNGSSICVLQMGPDFLLVEPAENHPPCEATVILQVDNSERRWKVRLPDGISKDANRVALALCD